MSGLAYAGAGISQGIQQAQQIERERPMREARLAEAQNRQRLSEMQLQEYQQNAPNRQMQQDLQMQQLQMATQQQASSMLKDQTYNAFRGYEADGDVRHLNNFLADAKRNPMGARMYGDITRVDPIDTVSAAEVQPMLRQAGIDDFDEFYADPELMKNFVVFTRNDGTRDISRMDQMYASTGFTNYMTNQQLQQMSQRAQISNLLMGPKSAETQLIRDIYKEMREADPTATLAKAAAIYGQSKRRQGGSALERIAQNVRAENPQMSEEEALRQAKQLMTSGSEAEREAYRRSQAPEGGSFQEEFEDVTARRERTSAQKDIAATKDVRAQLDQFGDGDFLAADLTDPNIRGKAGVLISDLEKLSGRELSSEDKRVARQIRDLTALGSTAGENITEKEAGLIDSTILRPIKKYITNEVEGIEGTAAYEAFRNIFRNALYGASLTQSEISAFEKAMGNLKQQEGPVLKQLQVQMSTLKNNLQAVADMNDPYLAKYYFGTSLDELDRAIDNIDVRIEDLLQPKGGRYTTAEGATDAPTAFTEDMSAEERKARLRELRRSSLGGS